MAHNVAIRLRKEGGIEGYDDMGKELLGAEPTDPGYRAIFDPTWEFICGGKFGLDHHYVNPMASPEELRQLGTRRALVTMADQCWFVERARAYSEGIKKCGSEEELELYETKGEAPVFFLPKHDNEKAVKELALCYDQKSPLRCHALCALALIAASHPRDVVAPLVPRILAAALCRVRDQDSSVRTAAVASASTSAVLRPLTDALLHEQDQCAQLAAALAMAAAVEASAVTVDLASYLHRLQPRLLKLLRSNAFKAKPAHITLIGACATMGADVEVTASISCLRDAIASDDWATRKAAAEALAALALEHTDLLTTYKSSCVTFFKARRFDKVKVVRESINRMIEAWKEIPGSASDGRYPAASLGSNSVPSATRKSILSVSRSSSPDVSTSVTKTNSPSSIRNKKLSPPSYHKVRQANNCDYKVNIVVSPDATPIKVVTEEKLLKGRGVRDRLESRRTLFKGSEDRSAKLAAHKAGSRVVLYEGGGNLE
ncbi:ARM repeat superfamily protein [Zea mays]|uniref:ARM repeat superfamily protein n=1 Tax=Zea mays TaxID=4577 RepID=A0A1D6NQU0_MAIZE|nr:ARM repeat superfamily protein [Zea mays]